MIGPLPSPVAVFLAAFLLAFAAAPTLGRVLNGPGWWDLPRADRHSRRAVSRAGGAGWLLGFGGALLLALPGFAPGPIERSPAAARFPGGALPSWGMGAGLALLGFLLGRWDDAGRLRPGWKWLLQSALLAAGIGLWWGLGRGVLPAAEPSGSASGGSPGAALLLLAVLVALGTQTALQIFDNLDAALGLVAGAACLSVGLSAEAGPAATPALAAGGALLGVLGWNLPPARVYFGNCGSLPVATLLAFWAFETVVGASTPAAAPAEGARRAGALLPLAWPLADLVYVTAARVRRGVPPWVGGRDHSAHRLARALGSDRAAAAAILVYAAATAGLSLSLAGRLWSR